MELPRLDADGLVLDAPRMDDAADWSDAQDEECARWFDWPCPPGLARCTEHLRHLTSTRTPDTFTWAIRTPHRFAGGIDLKLVAPPVPEGQACDTRVHEGRASQGQWNVSYFVHPDLRGQQVATRALHSVCAWAFAHLGLDVITTRTHVDNLASQRVLEKVGFRKLGTVPAEDADHLDRLFRLDHGTSGAA